jgi:uncharacterized protein (TIGR00106 family)
MLVELSILPLRGNTHLSDDLAEVLKLIDASGLRYQLTPSGTCIEGDWDDVMTLVHQCHHLALTLAPHVFTTIRIEDEKGEKNKLERNVEAVEAKVGRRLSSSTRGLGEPVVPNLGAPGDKVKI